jgi:hypothetical protein
MTKKQLPPPGIVLPSSNLAHRTEQFGITAQAHVNGLQAPTAEERYIAEQMRLRLGIQLASAIMTEHAQHLTQVITLRTTERFNEFVEADTAIRDQERNVRDQADVEYFNNAMRQAQATTLAAIRAAGASQIEGIVSEPFHLREEAERVVEQDPGFWERLVGKPKIIRVRG